MWFMISQTGFIIDYKKFRARKKAAFWKMYYVFNNSILSKDFLVFYLQVIYILQQVITSA